MDQLKSKMLEFKQEVEKKISESGPNTIRVATPQKNCG